MRKYSEIFAIAVFIWYKVALKIAVHVVFSEWAFVNKLFRACRPSNGRERQCPEYVR